MHSKIRENIHSILRRLPAEVTFLAAAKKRTAGEIKEAVDAGIQWIGMNYIQEAKKKQSQLMGLKQIKWSMIGALQKNKVKLAVRLFDRIETLGDVSLAKMLNQHAIQEKKSLSVFIQINIAEEPQKNGVHPQALMALLKNLKDFENLHIEGLMTMGPKTDKPEELSPHFQRAKALFEEAKSIQQANLDLRFLSMGMSASYELALAEGANYLRLGTAIFGPRPSSHKP